MCKRIGRRSALKRMAAVSATALALVVSSTAAAGELKAWVGGGTPALDLPLLDGGRVELSSLKGKVVLVNFWATWCAPCIKEMPAMQQLARTLGSERLAVIAVNYGEAEDRIRAFLKRTPLDLPIALDGDLKAARDWGAKVLPISFIVDRDGKIRYSALGELDWTAPATVAPITALTGR